MGDSVYWCDMADVAIPLALANEIAMVKAMGPWQTVKIRSMTRVLTNGVLNVMQAIIHTSHGIYDPTWCRLTQDERTICDSTLKGVCRQPADLTVMYAIQRAIESRTFRVHCISRKCVTLSIPRGGWFISFSTNAYMEKKARRRVRVMHLEAITRSQAGTIASLMSVIGTQRAMLDVRRAQPPPYSPSSCPEAQKIGSDTC